MSKKGANAAASRSLFNALGYTREEMERPLIGVVSSWNEIIPGHMNLDKIAQAVKMGGRDGGRHPDHRPGHRRLRRHRDGPHRDEVLAGYPRSDRRLDRGDGPGPPVRRPRHDPQLRQERPRPFNGRRPAQYPHRLRFRRPDARRPYGRPQDLPLLDVRGPRALTTPARSTKPSSRNGKRTPAPPAAPAPACTPPTR